MLTPRLELIPAGQAARPGDRLGVAFARLIWVTLIGLTLTGILLFVRLGNPSDLLDRSLYIDGYGLALAVIVWVDRGVKRQMGPVTVAAPSSR